MSIDALQEFQVQQSEYTAEFRNAGGVINATTKSGTSQVHFGGFDFFTNDKLDARAFFALSRPSTKRNQFGGWIGGPLPLPRVPKHSTFFFVDYEGWRQRIGQVYGELERQLGDAALALDWVCRMVRGLGRVGILADEG